MLTVLGHRGGRRFTSAFTTVLSSQRSPPNSQHALCHASGFGQRGQWGLSPPGPPSTPPHKNNLLGSAQNMTCTPTRRRLNNLSLSRTLSHCLSLSLTLPLSLFPSLFLYPSLSLSISHSHSFSLSISPCSCFPSLLF